MILAVRDVIQAVMEALVGCSYDIREISHPRRTACMAGGDVSPDDHHSNSPDSGDILGDRCLSSRISCISSRAADGNSYWYRGRWHRVHS
jgi:hypothetical protein